MFFNKLFKFIMLIIFLTSFVIFSGCGGGNPVIPPLPDNPDDSNIPESTETISQKIDLSIGGTIEVTDPESPINGVKLIIPPTTLNKDVKDSIATISISYLDNPYAVELPGNQGFLLPPVVINSDTILGTYCTLEIPYREDDLSNAGVSSDDTIKVYRYNYTSSSWEEIEINKRVHKDTGDILKIIFKPEDVDKPISCTILNSYPPSDLGLPQPGDLLYKLGSILPWEKEAKGWRPGHVGIYVGELVYDGVIYYNVIEALSGGVQRSYYNPVSEFSGSATYMGARQPKSSALTSVYRDIVVDWAKAMVGLPYAWGETVGILFGMLKGDLVKGTDPLGSYNCVGLAEKAYEIAGVNYFEGLVSDWNEGNSNLCILPTCILTPAEQYNKTKPAEGYTVSGRVTDAQGNGILDVILNFELVSFNDYHNSFEVITNSGGYWYSNKIGREWNVTPQKDGYIFKASVDGWEIDDPSTWIVKENAYNINFTEIYDEPNHPPVISSLIANPSSIDINETTNITCTASDQDGDTLTYTWTKNGGTFEGSTSGSSITWRAPTTKGSYTISCKISDGKESDSKSVATTVNDPGSTILLGQVSLSSPSNGATLPPGNITFTWNSVSNATKYQFMLYNYLGQVALDTIKTSTYLIVALGTEETITWKVRAGDNNGNWGAWSSTWSLTLKSNAPLDPPTPLSPGTTSSPGPTIDTLTPTLQWQTVSNADYYNLAISEYPYGTTNIIYNPQQISGSSITVPSGKLEEGKKYRWNMRAHNSAGFSEYSITLYFQTGSITCTSPGSFTLNATPECNGTTSQIRLNWTNSSGATSYDVYRNNTLYYSGLIGTQFINSGNITAGTTYSYYIIAKNSCDSTTSNIVSATAINCDSMVSASIDSYSPSSKITINTGQSFIISTSFTNTGNTADYFYAGVSMWDSNGNVIFNGWGGKTYLNKGQQGSASWSHTINTPGEYWLQFGVWNEAKSELLDKKPSPSQNLIKVVSLSSQTERLTNSSFSFGTSGWNLVGDFWAGTNFSNYCTPPGYAAGGVNSAGLPINNAVGYMYQTVNIPSGATSATLSFWYNITSEETGSTAYDVLNVTIKNSTGTYLATVAVLSNLNKSSLGSYSKVTFDVTPYKGQTFRVHFLATTDSSVYTVFRIDDVSLMSDG